MIRYQFQNVLCPFCKKSFVTQTYDEYDIVVNHVDKTIKGWVSVCPKCDSEVFVVENEYGGKDLSEFSENEIHRTYVLR